MKMPHIGASIGNSWPWLVPRATSTLRAQARLEAAFAEYEDPPGRQAVQIMLRLSDNGIWRCDYEAARDWAARAVERAGPEGDAALQAEAAAALSIGHAMCGEISEGLRWRDEAAATHTPWRGG